MDKERSEKVAIDKKRVLIALVLITALVGLGVFWGKDNLTKTLSKFQVRKDAGKVAGEKVELKSPALGESRQAFQKQVDEIKKNITQLKPEDIAKQGPVEKILHDLDDLKQKATESADILDVKGNLCEEAKKRFCQ